MGKIPRNLLPPRQAWLALALLAAAMELFYVLILRLGNLKEQVEAFLLFVLLLGILYFVCVYWVGKISSQRSLLVFVFLAAVVFRGTLFPLPPSLSEDLARYRWEGKAQQAGYNPYRIRPDDPKLSFLRDATTPPVSGPEFSTVYGPILEQVYWISVVFFDRLILLKLPYMALDLGVILLLFRLLPALGLSPLRAMIYAWNPLTVVEFAASGHNDSLPVFAFVLALLWWQRRKEKLSLVAVATSALAKLYAGFLLPVFLLRTSWKHLWVVILLAAAAFAPYAGAWGDFGRALSSYMRSWRTNDGLFYFLRQLTTTNLEAWGIYLLIVLAAIAYCLAQKLEPPRASFLILGTVLLFSPNVFPWYLTWILPVLAIYPNPAWLLFSVTVFLSYHVLILYQTLGLWKEETFFKLLEYAPVYGLLVGGFLVERWRQRSVRPAAS